MDEKTRKEIVSTLRDQGRQDLARAFLSRKKRVALQQFDALRAAADGHSALSVRHTNASAILSVYRNLNDENKEKFAALPLEAMGVIASRMINKRGKKAPSRQKKVTASVQEVMAAGWEDQAMAELAAELAMDLDLLDWKKDGNAIRIEGDRGNNRESEWLVFKNEKDAERYAIERVQDDIEDDPSMFNESFIKQHLFVTPTDIRIIAGEEAGNIIEMIDDEIMNEDYDRLMDMANMERQWDQIVEKSDELEEQLEMTEDPKEEKKLAQQLQKLSTAKEKFIDKAKDKVESDVYKQITRALKDDPLEWYEDLVGKGEKLPNWLSVDAESAAKEAVNIDGVAHFLDHYDGSEVELKSGAVAYGQN